MTWKKQAEVNLLTSLLPSSLPACELHGVRRYRSGEQRGPECWGTGEREAGTHKA